MKYRSLRVILTPKLEHFVLLSGPADLGDGDWIIFKLGPLAATWSSFEFFQNIFEFTFCVKDYPTFSGEGYKANVKGLLREAAACMFQL